MTRSEILKSRVEKVHGIDTSLWAKKDRRGVMVAQRKAFVLTCIRMFGDTDTYEHVGSLIERDHTTIAYYVRTSHWIDTKTPGMYRQELHYYSLFTKEASKVVSKRTVSFNHSVACRMLLGSI